MSNSPQSTRARIGLPACILLWSAALVPAVAPLGAQLPGSAIVNAESEFHKEPSGTDLGVLAKGTGVVAGTVRGNWTEVRFDGWLAANSVRTDRRDGYDVAVAMAAGTTLRSAPGGGKQVASLRAGTLFKRLESRGEWLRVQRSAWMLKSALTVSAPAAKIAAAPAATPVPAKPPTIAPTAVKNDSAISVSAGTTLSAQPAGSPLATLEFPVAATVLTRQNGWAKVRIEAWVREGGLGEAGRVGGPTAAEIRANPDRFIGQTVDWTLQVLAVQKADEMRPEIPPGQPYVLARGPLPETGFAYLVVSEEEAVKFRALEPLAKVRIRATIRAGRSRFLPTPVLNFVRRLD